MCGFIVLIVFVCQKSSDCRRVDPEDLLTLKKSSDFHFLTDSNIYNPKDESSTCLHFCLVYM